MNVPDALIYPVTFPRRRLLAPLSGLFRRLVLLQPTEEVRPPGLDETWVPGARVDLVAPLPLGAGLGDFQRRLREALAWAREVGLGEGRVLSALVGLSGRGGEETPQDILAALKGPAADGGLEAARWLLQLAQVQDEEEDAVDADLIDLEGRRARLESLLRGADGVPLEVRSPWVGDTGRGVPPVAHAGPRLQAWARLWSAGRPAVPAACPVGCGAAVKDELERLHEAERTGGVARDLAVLRLDEPPGEAAAMAAALADLAREAGVRALGPGGSAAARIGEIEARWNGGGPPDPACPRLVLTGFPGRRLEDLFRRAAGAPPDEARGAADGWSFFLV
ncbi:hypothetical protein G3N55_07335 [Dissulfurirhabdus thermomarina]|uniref:Uncharacterized protein n=1 Tax=Dissulfurirhabdus thermomarina TaxID=1765737 RepID=A0A6N9TMY7_DISTH|nr:hypothetical protein [Dissulfurirhabdus thermomarina]NDY42652.1 hypothetical protein [Dissulfurirhabdus thermomarina]